jgi:putative transcriptional regulator
MESFEAVGGALLDISAPEEMGVDSFEGVMSLIENECGQIAHAKSNQTSDLPSALTDYIGGSLLDVKWRPIGLGVKQSLLKTSGNSTARLLYIPAGTAVPHHSHNGNELTLVLKGAFEDEVSRFGPGDVEMADEDLDHQPVAVEGEDCICLAVTDAPLKFQTLVHKLVQPFLKI